MNKERTHLNKNYTSISDDQFGDLLADGATKAIVSFTTDWSSECHLLNNLNAKVAQHLDSISVFQINKERYNRYFNIYKLNKVPATLFLASGSIVHYLEGCPSYQKYLNIIDSVFQKETS